MIWSPIDRIDQALLSLEFAIKVMNYVALRKINKEDLAGCGKTLRSSFESLRTNGAAVEYAKFPFMLSPSKHTI
jgi:hypothetical protein